MLLPLPKPSHRRLWLLVKALEHLPLADALAVARAAEDFLTAPDQKPPAAQLRMIYPASTQLH